MATAFLSQRRILKSFRLPVRQARHTPTFHNPLHLIPECSRCSLLTAAFRLKEAHQHRTRRAKVHRKQKQLTVQPGSHPQDGRVQGPTGAVVHQKEDCLALSQQRPRSDQRQPIYLNRRHAIRPPPDGHGIRYRWIRCNGTVQIDAGVYQQLATDLNERQVRRAENAPVTRCLFAKAANSLQPFCLPGNWKRSSSAG